MNTLEGFMNVTRNKVTVAPSTVTRLDFTMRLPSICECVRVNRTLTDHLANADAVLHVRISHYVGMTAEAFVKELRAAPLRKR